MHKIPLILFYVFAFLFHIYLYLYFHFYFCFVCTCLSIRCIERSLCKICLRQDCKECSSQALQHYLSKLQIVFVQIKTCISLTEKQEVQIVFVRWQLEDWKMSSADKLEQFCFLFKLAAFLRLKLILKFKI